MSDALARQQAELIAALVLDGATPAGLPADRVAATRRQLLAKRARVVAACWPALASAVGTEWPDRFCAWADGQAPAGARVEGYRFARHLAGGPLPPAARDEVAAALLTWRETAAGLRPRRGPRAVRVGHRWYGSLGG